MKLEIVQGPVQEQVTFQELGTLEVFKLGYEHSSFYIKSKEVKGRNALELTAGEFYHISPDIVVIPYKAKLEVSLK